MRERDSATQVGSKGFVVTREGLEPSTNRLRECPEAPTLPRIASNGVAPYGQHPTSWGDRPAQIQALIVHFVVHHQLMLMWRLRCAG